MRIHRTLFRTLLASAALLAIACSLRGQTTDPSPETWSFHGQATTITQGHGAFDSPYEGTNSFQSRKEVRNSITSTLFLGRRLWEGAELYVNPELAGGQGDSHVLGLAAAPNGEIYRVDSSELKVSLARLFLRQTWSFGGGAEAVAGDQNQLAGSRDRRRLVLTAGKLALGDIFDVNAYAHDPRSQFLNWALMDTAAWDYPADTRGYSWGAAFELYWDAWALRAGSFMVPTRANGLSFDHQVDRAHGDVVEVEHDHELGGQAGHVRILGYANHADMGSYAESLQQSPLAPDVTATRQPGRVKYGWGLSADQALTGDLGAFLRAGWNDGHTETWVFTEVDRALAAGLSLAGSAWARSQDRLALSLAVNGLSPDHRDYLAAGGLGFMLGDGRLNYGQERLIETYYAIGLGRFLTATLDAQRIWNPGYNRDRGPVDLYALRLHVQF
ncbi:MAG: carbohydrate porin [Geothrix sp.]|nr:carbohydrate porin [Geothrix sp.]